MGEKAREALKLQFDKRLSLEFEGARITSDAGLSAWMLRAATGARLWEAKKVAKQHFC